MALSNFKDWRMNMERKNYLQSQLTKEEKLYLKRIIMTARNKYIEKNYDYLNNTSMLIEETVLVKEESVLDAVLQRCQEEVNSAVEFEKTISNPILYNVVKALSLREKEVLFYLYKKQKTIVETSKIMNIGLSTVTRLRDKAQSKIVEKIVKGE